jgi:AcrR family transcriptional regulator
MTVSRTYNSPLREEQMEQTREKLLEAMAELLAEESADVTVAMVAERARVSTRTAYRYFPTKEVLLDDFNEWMRKKFSQPPMPTSVGQLQDTAAKLVHYFEANEQLMRASRSLLHRELRKRRKIEQVKLITKNVAEAAPNLDPETVRLRAAMLLHLIGSESWMNLRDHWGFNPDQIIEAIQWAVRALEEQLLAEDQRAAKRRK